LSPFVLVWLKAIRVHQWVKNLLVFLPAVLAHQIFAREVMTYSVGAFVAFSLCASSVYLINDLFDVAADRAHPRKRNRPFAAGSLSARSGLVASAVLFCCASVLALAVGWKFAVVLAGYYVLTFSVLIFLSLGFVKRYTELDEARQAGKTTAAGRGYMAADLPLVMTLGVAAGYCTVVVMAPYINSADSQVLYRHNKPLWLICPLLLY
jgi:4-hydroxybenzoate polyprenyltransferase